MTLLPGSAATVHQTVLSGLHQRQKATMDGNRSSVNHSSGNQRGFIVKQEETAVLDVLREVGSARALFGLCTLPALYRGRWLARPRLFMHVYTVVKDYG